MWESSVIVYYSFYKVPNKAEFNMYEWKENHLKINQKYMMYILRYPDMLQQF